ncbi:hypothetical protein ACFX2I_043765 [Malus domestica]
MLSPCPSPCRCFGTRRKKAINQHLVSIFRSRTDYLEPLPDCLPSLALEYSSSLFYASSSSTTSTWEQIREVKMIPRSMWRQFANSSSATDKEKESKRWALGKIEERNRPTPLPRACLPCRRNKQRRMQTTQSNQPSIGSLI